MAQSKESLRQTTDAAVTNRKEKAEHETRVEKRFKPEREGWFRGVRIKRK